MPDLKTLETELQRLHEGRASIEERIRLAQARLRYGAETEAERRRAEEGDAAVELDRIMTRIRALEAKLALARRGLKPRIG